MSISKSVIWCRAYGITYHKTTAFFRISRPPSSIWSAAGRYLRKILLKWSLQPDSLFLMQRKKTDKFLQCWKLSGRKKLHPDDLSSSPTACLRHSENNENKIIARGDENRGILVLSSNCYCCSGSSDPNRNQQMLSLKTTWSVFFFKFWMGNIKHLWHSSTSGADS